MHSDARSLEFMANLNALFIDLLLNGNKSFNHQSIGPYTELIKRVMTYFGNMKDAQLCRRYRGAKETVLQFLDPITWNNLRSGVCGFANFAAHMLDTLPGEVPRFKQVVMRIGGQSSLEREFSAARRSGHDYGNNFGSHITD